jgi:uncharacterized membrane protein YbaN (DUF454 family)
MRLALLVFGWVFLGIGVIGAFVPALPTFDFMLLAAAFFARSSPRLEDWLVNRSRFGPALRSWRANRGISTRNKITATLFIVVSIGTTIIFSKLSLWFKVTLAIVGSGVVLYLATRPRPYGERGSADEGFGA